MDSRTVDRPRWTSADLVLLPDDGSVYEIIDGELFVLKSPHIEHQNVCLSIGAALKAWSDETGAGTATISPGVIFGDYDNVVPDVAWIAAERLAVLVDDAGHLTAAPDLVVEVLSAGAANERRDRELKLKLYDLRGVREYWLVDWRLRQIEVFRRAEGRLGLVATLRETDELSSPLLPGFKAAVAALLA